jgi:uncharacterized membrane protein YeaQ/YmgE (transglycosylase-associated protein family)
MTVLAWIILGAAAGWIASLIAGTDAEQGWLGNIIVGIIGAFIGGLVVQLFGGNTATGFNLASLLTAVLGAVILLSLIKGFRRSRV